MPKVSSEKVRLRPKDFDTATCGLCRYFDIKKKSGPILPYEKTYKGGDRGYCAVLEGQVGEYYVCDAYQGDEDRYEAYIVRKSDLMAFARGMMLLQPYKHIVKGGIDTPVGVLLLLRDTMKPPHHFSREISSLGDHLARVHGWAQKDINKIIKAGK